VLGFATATTGYLAVTTAESPLAPVVPVVRAELGIDLGTAGLARALLSLAIATGNLAGGLLLARRGARQGAVAVLAAAADVWGWRLSYGVVAALAAAAGLGCAAAPLPTSPAGGGLPGAWSAVRRLLRPTLLVAVLVPLLLVPAGTRVGRGGSA
jgi:hypothetical protein